MLSFHALVQHINFKEPHAVVEFETSTLSGRQWPTFRTCHDLFRALHELLVDKPGGWLLVRLVPGQVARMRTEHALQVLRACSREVAAESQVRSEQVIRIEDERVVLMRIASTGGKTVPKARREEMILIALKQSGPMTTRQLYTSMGWTRPTTRRVLQRLMADGRVEPVDASTTSPTQRYRLVVD